MLRYNRKQAQAGAERRRVWVWLMLMMMILFVFHSGAKCALSAAIFCSFVAGVGVAGAGYIRLF